MIDPMKLTILERITFNSISQIKICLYCTNHLNDLNWSYCKNNAPNKSINYFKCDDCFIKMHPTNPKILASLPKIIKLKICCKCSIELNDSNWLSSLQGIKNKSGYDSKICSDCYLSRQRENRKGRRLKLIQEYGNKCNCCGYNDDLNALDIDHVFNDGAEERKTISDMVIHVTNLGYPKDKYQLLCRNCNKIKQFNKGICNCKDECAKLLIVKEFGRKSKHLNTKFSPHDDKKCIDCIVSLTIDNYNKYRINSDKKNKYLCDQCSKVRQSNAVIKRRKIVLDHYGMRCNTCNYNIPMGLEIDHINNDGNIERKFKKIKCLYRHVIKLNFPTNYQILCCNCNYLKHIETQKSK